MNKIFNKSHLKEGHIVILRDGRRLYSVRCHFNGEGYLTDFKNTTFAISTYRTDLTSMINQKLDMMTVIEPHKGVNNIFDPDIKDRTVWCRPVTVLIKIDGRTYDVNQNTADAAENICKVGVTDLW